MLVSLSHEKFDHSIRLINKEISWLLPIGVDCILYSIPNSSEHSKFESRCLYSLSVLERFHFFNFFAVFCILYFVFCILHSVFYSTFFWTHSTVGLRAGVSSQVSGLFASSRSSHQCSVHGVCCTTSVRYFVKMSKNYSPDKFLRWSITSLH